jgi:2'-5' RNA ligase
MTLRFLGAIEQDRVDRVAAEVERSVTTRAGRVLCRGLGAFPKPSRAGVIFAAIDDAEGLLTELASQCDWAAQDAGLDPEERPFVPHITLSRLRPHQDVRRVLDAFGDFRVVIRIDTVSLMQTTIVRGELRYEALETFPLAR